MTKTPLKSRRRENRKPKILIAGLGNLLLRDDGVGVHAVRRFQKLGSKFYRAVEVGCAVFDALPHLEWADKVLLIDAMMAGSPPGTVYTVPAIEDLDDGATPNSLHELSIVQLLKMYKKKDPPEIAIIGVEPEIIEFGLDLSTTVESAIPLIIQTGQEIIREWGKEN